MTEKNTYMTDAELERLIMEVEDNELIPAPCDLQFQIMDAIEADSRVKQERIIAYKKYRFRVLTTVAAAALAVLFLPNLKLPLPKSDASELFFKTAPVSQSWYTAKTDDRNDRQFMEMILGDVNIFENRNKFNLFRE